MTITMIIDTFQEISVINKYLSQNVPYCDREMLLNQHSSTHDPWGTWRQC